MKYLTNTIYGSILILLLLIGWSDLFADTSTSYTWVYGGYAHNEAEYSDPYLKEMLGEDFAVFEVGRAYCALVERSTLICVKGYYQHKSSWNTSKDKGINSLNSGIEIRWY